MGLDDFRGRHIKRTKTLFTNDGSSRPKKITGVQVTAGAKLFRSYVLLFGIVPIDFSDLTLLEVRKGFGFLEQSPTGTMKLWRHERLLSETQSNAKLVVVLTDKLTFEPKIASSIVTWFIKMVFNHRHNVLREKFGNL
jgi:hypothetical protein